MKQAFHTARYCFPDLTLCLTQLETLVEVLNEPGPFEISGKFLRNGRHWELNGLAVHCAYGIFELVDIGTKNVVEVVTDNERVNETAATLFKAKRALPILERLRTSLH
jgi:hypothetical protein